ncbi:MAG TPA: LacI family DNA-binding transcriptional regulator [Clostridia bacterium]|nr:LacI family DNA-binding transcriptional regulator [Clostridia bacterium]
MSVTIDYVARMANVSKATVSRVINNKVEGVGKETRARVQKVIDEYGYHPNLLARGIATSRTKIIGLVIPDIMNPFFPAVVKSIEEYASVNGYTVILCNTDSSPEKESKCISTLIANRVDGVILASGLDEKNQIQQEFKKYSIPYVLIDRRMKNNRCAGIFVDNEYAFYTAADFLVKHGNTKIAFIQGPSNLSTTLERLEGYRSVLKQYDIPFDPDLVAQGDFSYGSGYKAVTDLCNKGTRFSAVLASNDMMAIGALNALHNLGYKIPDEIEVIGFDNIEFSKMVNPPLTTMEQPIYELGAKAAQALIKAIEGQNLAETNIRLEAKLVIRETTRKK